MVIAAGSFPPAGTLERRGAMHALSISNVAESRFLYLSFALLDPEAGVNKTGFANPLCSEHLR
jgi:hypothetical protein